MIKKDGNKYVMKVDPKNINGTAKVNDMIDKSATETSFDIVVRSNSGEIQKSTQKVSVLIPENVDIYAHEDTTIKEEKDAFYILDRVASVKGSIISTEFTKEAPTGVKLIDRITTTEIREINNEPFKSTRNMLFIDEEHFLHVTESSKTHKTTVQIMKTSEGIEVSLPVEIGSTGCIVTVAGEKGYYMAVATC